MPTIIDELTMTLSLDPGGFKEGAAEAETASDSLLAQVMATLAKIEQATKQTANNTARVQESAADKAEREAKRGADAQETAAKRAAREAEESTKKAARENEAAAKRSTEAFGKVGESIKRAGIELLAFLGISMTVSGMERLFMDISKTNVQAGYLSQTLGMSTRELTEWQGAASRLGGTAEGVAAGFNQIQQQVATLKFTGQSALVPVLRNLLGIEMQTSQGVAKNPTELLLEIADQIKKRNISGPDAQFMMNQMGMGGLTPMVMQGRAAIEKELATQRQIGSSDMFDAEKSREMLNALDKVQALFRSIARVITAEVSPAITDIANQIFNWLKDNRTWIEIYLIEGLRDFGRMLLAIRDDIKAAFNSDVVKQFSDDIKPVATAINNVVEQTVGWRGVVEGIFGLWLGPRFIALAARITGLTSLMGLLGAATNPVAAAFEAILAAGAMYEFNKTGREKIYSHAKEQGWTVTGEGTTDAKFSKGGRTLDYGGIVKEFGLPNGPTMLQSAGITRMPWETAAKDAADALKKAADAQTEATAREQLRQDVEDLERGIVGRAGGGNVTVAPGGFASPTGPRMPAGPISVTLPPADKAPIVADAAKRWNVPLEVAQFVGSRESNWNDSATGIMTPSGQAKGAWQFMDATARERGLADPRDFRTATDAAMHYLSDLKNKWGSWEEAIAHYGTFSTGMGPAADAQIREGFRNWIAAHPGGATAAPAASPAAAPAPAPAAPAPAPSATPAPAPAPAPSATPAAAPGGWTRPTQWETGYGQPTTVPARTSALVPRVPALAQLASIMPGEAALGAGTAAQRSQMAAATAIDRSQSSETHIGAVHVHTQATDAAGIARDLKGALKRYDYVTQADTGLA